MVLNLRSFWLGARLISPAGSPSRSAAKDKTPSILVLADHSELREMLEKSILEAHGFRVRVAVDGMGALEQLQTAKADLVIMDVQCSSGWVRSAGGDEGSRPCAGFPCVGILNGQLAINGPIRRGRNWAPTPMQRNRSGSLAVIRQILIPGVLSEYSKVIREFGTSSGARSEAGVAAAVGSAEEALRLDGSDVISMDIGCQDESAFEATRRIMSETPCHRGRFGQRRSDLQVTMNAAATVSEKPSGHRVGEYGALAERLCTQLAIMSQVQVVRRRIRNALRGNAHPAGRLSHTRDRELDGWSRCAG